MESNANFSISDRGKGHSFYLLPVIALALGILFDRLMFAPWVTNIDGNVWLADRSICLFWMCCLGVAVWIGFTKESRCNCALWLGGIGCAALCVWFFIYDSNNGNFEYSFFARLAIPAVLMTLAQYASGSFTLKDTGGIFTAFMGGWFYQPFSRIGMLAGMIGRLASGGKSSGIRKAIIGIVIAVPLLSVILPLLGGADQLFGYYLDQIARNVRVGDVVLHIIVALAASVLFFSFLWNLNGGVIHAAERSDASLDTVIWGVVLISVIAVYILFCAIQFPHLFARAGLPAHMTYAEYAREGFAQTMAVCSINMLLFGMCLRYSKRGGFLTALLGVLLALTAVMLYSGFVRLNLYIDAFGMTWLRLASGWFMIYLAAVTALSAARLRWQRIPLVGVCALVLLGWFLILGYANPDGIIATVNAAKAI